LALLVLCGVQNNSLQQLAIFIFIVVIPLCFIA